MRCAVLESVPPYLCRVDGSPRIQMEDYVVSPPPKLTVKFWPPSVTAEGVRAINAIRRPLAALVYARAATAVILGVALVWGGHELAPRALLLLKFW